jgi:anti-anti-sigma factor
MTTDRIGDVTVVRLDADYNALERQRLAELESALMPLAGADGPPMIVLDFTATEFVSSSLLEILFRLWNRIKVRNGKLVLCGLQPLCYDVVRIARIDTLVPIASDVNEALAKLAQG